MAKTYSAGITTAYGAAKRGGYTGTYEEFCAQQAAFAENAEQVSEDRAAVEQIKSIFENQTVPAAVQQVNQAGAAQVQAVQAAGADKESDIAAAGAAQETRVLQAGADQESAVNAAGSTQVEAVQSAGAAQVTAVQGAGTTQVAAVNAAGATQANAVENKGEEVLASIPQDYSALTGEVAGLKSATSDIEDTLDMVPGKNLINFAACEMNAELNNRAGETIAKTGWYVTDWIPVEPNTTYALSGTSSAFKAETNAEKTQYTGTMNVTDGIFTTGPNSRYVRFNSQIEGYTTPQLEKGDVITAYEPYHLSSKRLAEVDKHFNSLDDANALNYKNVSIPLDFQQGRVQRGNDQKLYITQDSDFVYSECVLLSDRNVEIAISEPLRVIWWVATDTASNGGTAPGAPSWNTAPYATMIRKNQQENHLVICLTRNGTGELSPADCDGLVTVSYQTASNSYNADATNGQVFYVGGTKLDSSVNMTAVCPCLKGKRIANTPYGTSGFSESDDEQFAYVKFFNVPTGSITIHADTGYRVYAWATDVSELDTTTGGYQLLTTSWTRGDITVDVQYPNLVISIMADESTFGSADPVSVSFTKSTSGKIVNGISNSTGTITACVSDGDIIRIGYDSAQERLLHVDGTNMDWRLCWVDSAGNTYVSPHASIGALDLNYRGLYRLPANGSYFEKVISLYDPNSSIATERDSTGNKDTIWTMCEDENGYLYAGVYAHGERVNPAIYKSEDGGVTWEYLVNFIDDGILTSQSARHIHAVAFSKWQHAIYCIVGEVNTVLMSTDEGNTWQNLNVTLEDKGTVLFPTPGGILIGSDTAYNMSIDLLLNDNKTHVNVFNGWANTVFAIRRSDVTGWLYAFTKIDISVNETSVFPPASVLEAETEQQMWEAIETWKNSVSTVTYVAWHNYYRSICRSYPDDCIRPQHFSVLVSKDGGATWDVCKTWAVPSTNYYGIWCVGQFRNGECIMNRVLPTGIANPMVLSEGKHKYVSAGCDFDGEIFIKTNANTIAEII